MRIANCGMGNAKGSLKGELLKWGRRIWARWGCRRRDGVLVTTVVGEWRLREGADFSVCSAGRERAIRR